MPCRVLLFGGPIERQLERSGSKSNTVVTDTMIPGMLMVSGSTAMHPLAVAVSWNHAIFGALFAAAGTALLIEAVRDRVLSFVVLAAAAMAVGAEELRSAVPLREVQITVVHLGYSAYPSGSFDVYDASGRLFKAPQSLWEDLSEGDRVRCRATRPLVRTPTLASCEQLRRGSDRHVTSRAR